MDKNDGSTYIIFATCLSKHKQIDFFACLKINVSNDTENENYVMRRACLVLYMKNIGKRQYLREFNSIFNRI